MNNCAAAPDAVAHIRGDRDHSRLRGQVRFYQKRCGVLVVADLWGLPLSDTGFFGLHIHEGNSCAGDGFSDTGSHYNPSGNPHPLHAGDLPPVLSYNGRAHLTVITDRFRVSDILGRTIVIHSDPDDFRSQPAGNAGVKIACGDIRGK